MVLKTSDSINAGTRLISRLLKFMVLISTFSSNRVLSAEILISSNETIDFSRLKSSFIFLSVSNII